MFSLFFTNCFFSFRPFKHFVSVSKRNIIFPKHLFTQKSLNSLLSSKSLRGETPPYPPPPPPHIFDYVKPSLIISKLLSAAENISRQDNLPIPAGIPKQNYKYTPTNQSTNTNQSFMQLIKQHINQSITRNHYLSIY